MSKSAFSLILVIVCLNLFRVVDVFGQEKNLYWKETSLKTNAEIAGNKQSLSKLKLFELDEKEIQVALSNVPDRFNDDQKRVIILLFPNSEGVAEHFRIYETSNMDPALAAAHPEIKSYIGKGIDDPTAIMYFSISPLGLQTMTIRADKPAEFIEPYTKDRSAYAVYTKRDKRQSLDHFECRVLNTVSELVDYGNIAARPNADDGIYRTYRLALSVTGEYTVYFGGTQALALAAMNNTMTRVNGICEIDCGIHMNMIANENAIIYTNASTDPYSNASTGAGGAWNQELQTNLTNIIGSANYDIGHLFGATGGGGNAGCIGCVCVDPTGPSSLKKGSGFTSPADGIPSGDNFDVDYVIHEMGHQFGGNHTFTHSNEGTGVQMEPGSGSTIMGYAGITSLDVQPHSDPLFHAVSIQQITNYIKTTTCQVNTTTNNNIPAANAGLDYTIPKSTAFALTGSATDADGDALSYIWEEMDNGTSSTAPSPTKTTGPDFRSYIPSASPVRYCPIITSTIAGSATTAGSELTVEALPSVARTLNFRFTVRDNHAGGPSNNSDDMVVTVNSASGPFVVTAPNTAITWAGNSTQTVTWNVASTTASPVSCANVKISLSIDGGFTFPTVIAASTPNDGSEAITVPNFATTTARIKVEAVGNIFFDMSNTNFTIINGSGILTTIFTSALASNNYCAGASLNIDFTTDGPANAGNYFTAQLSNSSGSFASPDSIGSLTSINQGTIAVVIPAGKPAGSGYRIRVVSSNPAVTGSDNGSNISVYATPAGAGSITGNATVCQGQSGVAYSVPAIANATTYSWTLPTGGSIASGTGTNNITVNYSASASSGNITVTGSNPGCSGTASPNFAVTVNNLPSAAGAITGTVSVCQGQSGITFSVASIPGATSYTWNLTTGASITAGIGTNVITVTFSASAVSGNITVTGTNSCGNGTASSFAVAVAITTPPPVISASGSTSVCSPSTVDLSFTTTAGVTYQWRKDGVNIGGATSSTYTATQTGNYDVVATGKAQQTFINNNYYFIPDNICTGATSPIIVSGYAANIATSSIYVKLDSLIHPFDGDLVIFLQAPNGAILGLANRVGSSGDNFINTVVADSGSSQMPTNFSNAPYSNLYKPWTSTFTSCITSTLTTFAAIGGGSLNPNGIWYLKAYDRGAQDTGSVRKWTIVFPAAPSVCTSTSNSIAVTVNSPVTASVGIAASPSNIICAGTNVTFTATPTNGGSSPTYQWKKNGSNVGTNSTTYSDNALANNDVITCVMTSNATCVSGSPATSNSVTMTVNVNVTASVSIVASPSNIICAGTNVTFTATPTNGGSTPAYQWKKNGNNVGTNSTTYSDNALASNDVITCVMTSNATCVNGSPATSSGITMTVNANVTASVSIGASPSNVICAGTNVTFTATPTNGGSTPAYQWKKNGNNVGTNSTTYSDNALASNDVITCVMTSNATCVNGSPATSSGITMTVNANVTASVSIGASPSNVICAGTNVTFTATPTNGGSTPAYQWKKNGNNVGTNSITYSDNALASNDVITCVMTSNATCVNGSPATSSGITMTVNANVTASVGIGASPSNVICAGTNVTFTATPTNGGSTPAYQWKKNGSNVGSNSTTYSDNALANNDVITCVMTSNATCLNGSPATSNDVAMTVNPNPVVSSFNPSSGVAGSSVIISGSGFTNASSVSINGVNASFVIDNDIQITATIPNTTSGIISVTTNCGTAFSSTSYTVITSATLTVKFFIEGFYSSGSMQAILYNEGKSTNNSHTDSVQIILHQSFSPFDVDTTINTIVSTDGYVNMTLPGNRIGNSYYIVMKHRNTLETWSNLPVTIGSNTSFDFTR